MIVWVINNIPIANSCSDRMHEVHTSRALQNTEAFGYLSFKTIGNFPHLQHTSYIGWSQEKKPAKSVSRVGREYLTFSI